MESRPVPDQSGVLCILQSVRSSVSYLSCLNVAAQQVVSKDHDDPNLHTVSECDTCSNARAIPSESSFHICPIEPCTTLIKITTETLNSNPSVMESSRRRVRGVGGGG